MLRLNLTLPTPAENLALDEALLEWAEDPPGGDREALRIWEPTEPVVVAGRSTRIAQEINTDECRSRHIPILRRSSGGATIITGPGCLMYALVLSYQLRPDLKDIGRAHAFVLNRLVESLQPNLAHIGTVSREGTSDLAIRRSSLESAPRKFSGNSLRVKRTHCLYHGTLLYDFDLESIASCLLMPSRQPDYRSARPHGDFVRNIPLTRPQLTAALNTAFPTTGELNDVPLSRTQELTATRFTQAEWTFEFP
jgi:lipoate---protein ligase